MKELNQVDEPTILKKDSGHKKTERNKEITLVNKIFG